ncbi:hypothetical protein [Trinickia diaoshuihuensis]|uniref:hypothetical protein n=1 Tax=Trinickia diaoshuihuensis TaxID=2292265 RepID=UPI000E26E871|nr:hypothetical protein [Trinickia diaoshuihuensis]
MNPIGSGAPAAFLSALASPGRATQIDEADDVYGWLVGSWALQVLHYRGYDVREQGLTGELHACWVLDGRAIQDVWIMPAREDRRAGRMASDPQNDMYGSTLRAWDPGLRAWRISWNNPARGHRETQTGRRIGSEIVQTGARADGQATRWRFTDITAERFHWIGEALDPDGETWRLEGEFIATRIGSGA